MAGPLRDQEKLGESNVAETKRAPADAPPWPANEEAKEERRPPVLGVVLSFIVLFWGGVLALWLLWPR